MPNSISSLSDLQKIFPDIKEPNDIYHLILSNLSVGVGIFEVVGSQIHAVYLNEHFHTTIGYTKEQYNRYLDNVTATLLKSDEKTVFNIIKNSSDENQEYSYVVRGYRADKSIGWFQIKARRLKSDEKLLFIAMFSDISDQKAIEHSLHLQSERYRIFEETTPAILFDYNVADDFMRFSYNLKNKLYHREIPDYTEHSKTSSFVHPDDIEGFTQTLKNACATPTRGFFEYRSLIVDPDKYTWCRTFYSSIDDGTGVVSNVFGRIQDIEDEIIEKQSMIRMVESDSLTQVYNKTAAFEKIESILECGYENVCLAVVDIDDFKSFNDKYGHINGDIVLKTIARLLRGSFKNNIVGRFGGDEFIVFAVNTKADEMLQKFEAIKKKSYVNLDDKDIEIVYSIGIFSTKRQVSYDELFSEADKIMYHAKNSGKNQIIVQSE